MPWNPGISFRCDNWPMWNLYPSGAYEHSQFDSICRFCFKGWALQIDVLRKGWLGLLREGGSGLLWGEADRVQALYDHSDGGRNYPQRNSESKWLRPAYDVGSCCSTNVGPEWVGVCKRWLIQHREVLIIIQLFCLWQLFIKNLLVHLYLEDMRIWEKKKQIDKGRNVRDN